MSVYYDQNLRKVVISSDPGADGTLYLKMGANYNPAVTALSDWNSRKTGPGILWSQTFTNQALDIDRFLLSGGIFPTTANGGMNPSGSTVTYGILAGGGILGQGCMRINVPVGQGGDGRWSRPFAPFASDINQPGAPTIPNIGNNSHDVMAVWQGPTYPYIAHPGEQIANPFAAQDGAFRYLPAIGAALPRIYWQVRLRVSPGRFGQSPQMPRSKWLMFENNYDDPNGELCTNIGGYGLPPNTATADNGLLHMYTAKGNDESIMTPGPGGPRFQPGGDRDSTCLYPNHNYVVGNNNCIFLRENEWMTIRGMFQPGRAGVAETQCRIEIQFQEQVATGAFYTLFNLTNMTWPWTANNYYSVANRLHPYGLNRFQINTFTGGNTNTPAPAAYWTDTDQVLFGLQQIPWPQV